MLNKLTRRLCRNVSTNAVFVYRPCQTCQYYHYSVKLKIIAIRFPEVIGRMCRKFFSNLCCDHQIWHETKSNRLTKLKFLLTIHSFHNIKKYIGFLQMVESILISFWFRWPSVKAAGTTTPVSYCHVPFWMPCFSSHFRFDWQCNRKTCRVA